MGMGCKKSMHESLIIPYGEPDEMRRRNHDIGGVEERRLQQ